VDAGREKVVLTDEGAREDLGHGRATDVARADHGDVQSSWGQRPPSL
jgi:hypothetical protein